MLYFYDHVASFVSEEVTACAILNGATAFKMASRTMIGTDYS
jgi:hypothetical protein